MINNYTVMGLWFNVFVTIMLPIVAVTMLAFNKKISLPSILSGGATFFLAHMVLLTPINNFIKNSGWFSKLFNNGTAVIPYLIFLAVLATLVVETVKYLSVKYTIGEKSTTFSSVIGFTLGFTCLESLLLVGINTVQNLYFAFMINNGQLPLLAAQLGTDEANAIFSTISAINGDTLFMMGVERLFMAVTQFFLTTFVFLAIKYKKPVFFGVAVATSLFLNLTTTFLSTFYSSLGSLLFQGVCTMGFIGFLMDVPKVFAGQAIPKARNQQPRKKSPYDKK